MSIATELEKLKARRDSIVTAITDKGGTCESEATLAACATAIASIPSGGGSSWTGHADEEGLKAIGWTDEDVAYFKNNIHWNEEWDDFYKVSSQNISLYTNATKVTVDGIEMASSTMLSQFRTSRYCRYLPKIDVSKLSSISFSGMQQLIAVPSLNVTEYTTSLTKLFANCYNLISVDVANWVTINVTDLYSAFDGVVCDFDISNFDLSKCNNITSLYEKRSARIVSFGKNLNRITSLYCVLYSNSIVVIADFSGVDTSKVSNMQYLFYGCGALSKVILSDNFVFNSVTSNSLLPTIPYLVGCDFESVRYILNSMNLSSMSIESPTMAFESGSVVTDNADGTLQTLMDACVAKGWTISNLTINAYGS